jgi:hypothetical protein
MTLGTVEAHPPVCAGTPRAQRWLRKVRCRAVAMWQPDALSSRPAQRRLERGEAKRAAQRGPAQQGQAHVAP